MSDLSDLPILKNSIVSFRSRLCHCDIYESSRFQHCLCRVWHQILYSSIDVTFYIRTWWNFNRNNKMSFCLYDVWSSCFREQNSSLKGCLLKLSYIAGVKSTFTTKGRLYFGFGMEKGFKLFEVYRLHNGQSAVGLKIFLCIIISNLLCVIISKHSSRFHDYVQKWSTGRWMIFADSLESAYWLLRGLSASCLEVLRPLWQFYDK